MAALQGTILASKIVPTDSLDTYATHEDKYGRGGHRSVDTIVERDEISPERRKEGMTVYVKSTKVKYVLEGGLTNEFWLPEASSGSIDLSNYYKKLETYSKAQVDALVAGGVADLSDYYKKAEVDGLLDSISLDDYYTKTQTEVLLSNKVEKEDGKGLSTNDFTNTFKQAYDGHLASTSNPHNVTALQVGAYSKSENDNLLDKKANLDINNKIPLSEIPDSILGQLKYMGVWDFSSGLPTGAQKGNYWITSVSGNGYEVGDWAVYNGTSFDKVDNTDAVSSVAGRTGNVVLNKNDVGLNNVDNTSDTNKPISTATQTALNSKVDKVAGKGLSTEDYTTAEKTKLTGLSNYTKPASEPISYITGLQTALDSKVSKTGVETLHSTDALRISGTTLSLYKGDGTFESVVTQDTVYTLPNASATVLGGIKVGTNLSIDANGVLSANDTNVSFTEISNKPTNLSGYGITDAYTKTQVDSLIPDISTKQDNLVSGTNIKTINGQSVLGSGDIEITGEEVDLTNYYSKIETETLLSAKVDKVDTVVYDGHLANTSNPHNTTANQVGAYSKIEVDNLLANIDISEATLTNYYDKPQTETLLSNKVEKEAGKGLSTNDFTDTFKQALELKKVQDISTDSVTKKLVVNYTDGTFVDLNLDDIITDVKVEGAVLDATTNTLTIVSSEGGADVVIDLSLFVTTQTLNNALLGKADNIHSHSTSDIIGLDTTLSNKVTKNEAIIGATKTKITYDSNGLVINGADLSTSDIPNLPQSKIINLETNLSSKIDKGVGVVGATKTKITYNDDGIITGGADFVEADLPNISQSKITNLVSELSNKQSSLISGINIKTINGQSVLGNGNIEITTETDLTDYYTKSETDSLVGGKGDTGEKGDTGAKGDKGDKGDDGNGIVSVVRTSGTGAPGTTDTFTITFTDTTTSTFNVYNGQDGIGVISDTTITTDKTWSSSKTREEIAKAKPSTAFLMAYSN